MYLHCKYLIASFIIVASCLQQCCLLGQSTTVRPYKFGFTIDEQQHRSEQRDERGIVMGEFGFITADGIYHVTVYATDEQGRFRILAMKNYPYKSPPKTVEVMVQPKIPPKTTTTTTTPKTLPRHNFHTEACSGCFLVNGDKKPKDINGIKETPLKSDIRPLSKALPKPGSSSKTPNEILNKTSVTATDLNRNVAIETPAVTNSLSKKYTTNSKTILQNSAPKNSFEVPVQQTTDSSQGNTLTKTPQSAEATTLKEKVAKPTVPNINSLNTQYTTNYKAIQAQQSNRGLMSTTKTQTGSPPPIIMDIIMQKVLPTLMGEKEKTPTLYNANVPSGNKPSTSNSAFENKRNPSGSSGPPGENGDGDLYRFKYILDYHGHSETGKRNGNKEGSYFAIGDDDVERTIEYVANEFGYQPRIRWRKSNRDEIKSKENTLKDYEFVWFQQ